MATKKLVIEKSEGVGEVVDRVLGEPDVMLIVVIPKGSPLGKSMRNFHLLRREAESAGKTLVVESVDENILAFARDAGMEASHPLWKSQGSLSDIVAVTAEIEDDESEKMAVSNSRARGKQVPISKGKSVKLTISNREAESEDDDEAEIPVEEEEIEEETEAKESFFGGERFFKDRKVSRPEKEEEDDRSEEASDGSARKWIWGSVAVLVVAVGVCYGLAAFFGRVTIAINFQKTPWAYQNNFIADKSVSTINAVSNTIPAQLFTIPKNTTQLFSASGQQNVSLKAQGTVTIYNAYSSSPQSLVATTRFMTPDGKIFRLVNGVVVPGAAVTNGQIVPSSISAAIVADQAGPDYNVSPVAKLTIPGFKGSPKYNAFYGSIASSTSGGFVGEKAVPTADDITAAKQKVTDLLTSELQGGLSGSYTNNFKILDGATNVAIGRLTVNTTTDDNGKFSVFGEATLTAVGFDESKFKDFLLSIAQTTEASSTWKDLTLTYSNIKPDFTKGTLSFALTAQGSLEPQFSVNDFQSSIAGKSISDAKSAISGIGGLQNGTISVWPSWLWRIPTNTKKINVTTD